MHPHEDCIGAFDATDPIGSAINMIAKSNHSRQFRGSPVIACLTEVANVAVALREEMKAIALATGRSQTDGESDTDWAYMAEEVAELARDAARYRWLRERDLDTIDQGGVFAGKTPDNIVISHEDLDAHVDAAIAAERRSTVEGGEQ